MIGLIFFVFCTTHNTHVHAQDHLSHTITIDTTKDDYHALIEKEIIAPFTVTKCSFSTDVFFENTEFLYLTGLQEGTRCTSQQLIEAVSYLIKKNRFSTIKISIIKNGHDHNSIHMDLVGLWTFSQVKIHGLILGKDVYKRHYDMEPGDPFNEQVHKASLAKIEDELRSKGFFSSSVTSVYKRDAKTKSIKVHLTIDRGPSFSTVIMPLVLHAHKDTEILKCHELKHYLEKAYLKTLSNATYLKKNSNTAALALRNYLFAQGFLEPKIELQERINIPNKLVYLSFNITLGEKTGFTFLGNLFFSSADLLHKLMLLGPSFWMLPLDMLEQELIRLYKEKGFKDVTITTRTELKEVFFIINEGARSYIKAITIQGCSLYSEQELIKNYFKDVQKHGYYDDYLFQKAIDELCDAYRKEGFFQACVQNISWNSPTGSHLYQVELLLEEGPRSRIVSIKIPGYEHLENQGPCAINHDQKSPVGKPCTSLYMAEQRSWITQQLEAQGITDFHITYELKQSGQELFITWLIHKNPLSSVRFGKTVVVSNSGFPFEVLQRTFCYHEGDAWDQKLLKNTLTRIKELDVFERVHVYPYNPTLSEEKKTVLIKVQKDDRFELRLRPGVALQQVSKKICFNGLTYKLGGSFIVKNPMNVGDQLRIKADVTRSQRVCEMAYSRPFLFSFPIKTLYKIYNNRYQQPGCIGVKKNVYSVTQQGFLANITQQNDLYEAGLTTGIEYMETVVQNTKDEHGIFARSIAKAINFEPRLLGKKIPYAVIEPSLIINHVDNSAFPHHGFFTVASLKGMFPLGKSSGDIYFIRLLAEQSVYIPIKKVVLALRCRVGHIFHQIFSAIMPTERFYLGGANSIRSYETDLCPPLGKVCSNGEEIFVPQGGKSMVNCNIEARFPLYNKLGGVLFQDVGCLSKTVFSNISQENLLAATGVGLRYHTPLGPLRFDFGIKWHAKVPHESRYAWFLTFGHAF